MQQNLIIIDKKMPAVAKEKLTAYGQVLELKTTGITYPAISGHPDIFLCQSPSGLFVAPNLPERYFLMLDKLGVNYRKGETFVGNTYPHTVPYNAVATTNHLIHNLNFSDPILLKHNTTVNRIHVNQGYTRCNLISLSEELFITSDEGIYNTLVGNGFSCHHFPANDITLENFPHGFLGGVYGIRDNKLFICGSLVFHSRGHEIRRIVEKAGYQIIELMNRPLQDIGSIMFEDI